MIGIYKGLMTLAFPLIRATYIKKRQKLGKEHPARFNERLGIYKHPRPAGKLYWLHGASLGEAVSMLPLIDRLLKDDPELSILVTTGTLSSAEVMAKRLPARAFHQFIPFDVPKFARRLLTHFRPDAVLWFESELWPSLISEIRKTKIPLILVNGRVSDKSFHNWQKLKGVAKELLGCFNLCLGQSEQDRKRLQFLGAEKTDCYGNLKYAGAPLPVDEAKFAELKALIGGKKVFFISSTHHNEEEQLAAHFERLRSAVDDVFVIIAPRHPERGKEVAEMLKRKGFEVSLRSAGEAIGPQTMVYVADTIGEMGLWYALSDISFVGGSLINHGGQNFMEPARDKNAVIVGPHMHNFVEMMERAQANGAVWQVMSAADVIEEVIMLFRENDELLQRQQRAYDWTVKESAVLDGIVEALRRELAR